MRNFLACVALATLVLSATASDDIVGFTEDHAKRQRQLESRFDKALDKDNYSEWMERMTLRPHHVGSVQAKANAEFIADQFKKWGYDTRIEIFHVLFPTPKVRELQMLEPTPFTASLQEEIVDAATADALRAEGLPPYNAYSADGDVTGELVYVNRGIPEDYEELERHGIDVKGKIVIARYGGSWRGIKPKVAAEKGAIGCIIFNDPGEDGFTQGDAYPNGAFKHDTAVQRGSIVDLPTRPGDPLTPNYGATEDAKRLTVAESETIMKIPNLPISYADALPLMQAMGGPRAPEEWRGAMPVTYRLGGDGKTKVRLHAEFNWDITPAYNVIAVLRGSEYPDEWIIRGNHHDAWVIGARDPISGMITVMEEARAVAKLGKPKRTIVYCAWDAEEPGLLGSTEWAEHHADELRDKAVAYINTDGNSRGFLGISGSHALETLANQVARDVTDPQTGISLAERRKARVLTEGTPEQKKLVKAGNYRISPLGSGSDYTPFLQHLGIASLDARFGGEGEGGEYHTMFDTFTHYSTYLDPNFEYAHALTQVCGRLTLRLANADVLPFDFTNSAAAIGEYADEVVKLADDLRTKIAETNELIANGSYKSAADPTETYVVPAPKEAVPHINFAPLKNAVEELKRSADAYNDAVKKVLAANPGRDKIAELDRVLLYAERAFIDPEGLPRRPWYRHQIYAPGFYTGYGVKTLPGVREGIEERKWAETDHQIARAAAAIIAYAKAVQAAASMCLP